MTISAPLSTHIFLLAVPLLIAVAAVAAYLFGGSHER